MLDQQPVGALEIDLVRQMAEHLWLAKRATRYQEGCFVVVGQTPEQKANNQMEMGVLADLERFTHYQNQHERALHRALNALLKLRKEREKAEIGFVRRKHAEAEESRREKRQQDRDKMFEVRYATAKHVNHLTEVKVIKAIAAFGGPEMGKFGQLAA